MSAIGVSYALGLMLVLLHALMFLSSLPLLEFLPLELHFPDVPDVRLAATRNIRHFLDRESRRGRSGP